MGFAGGVIGLALGGVIAYNAWQPRQLPQVDELQLPGIVAGCNYNDRCESFYGENEDNCRDCEFEEVKEDQPAVVDEENQSPEEDQPVEEEEDQPQEEEPPQQAEIEQPLPPTDPLIDYWAEPGYMNAGECFDLYWHVENVQKVIFGGVEQPADGHLHPSHL